MKEFAKLIAAVLATGALLYCGALILVTILVNVSCRETTVRLSPGRTVEFWSLPSVDVLVHGVVVRDGKRKLIDKEMFTTGVPDYEVLYSPENQLGCVVRTNDWGRDELLVAWDYKSTSGVVQYWGGQMTGELAMAFQDRLGTVFTARHIRWWRPENSDDGN